MKTNLLRVNSNFHNRPRYDFVLIDAGAGTHFVAQLLYVFGVFAVGDVRSGSVKRVASAVGEGSVVVQAVHARLASLRESSPITL